MYYTTINWQSIVKTAENTVLEQDARIFVGN